MGQTKSGTHQSHKKLFLLGFSALRAVVRGSGMGSDKTEEVMIRAYIELLLGFGEAVASTGVNKEDDGVHVGEILSPDLAR